MSYAAILPAYLIWHFGEAYKDINRVWTNFVWFTYNFFSLSIMLKTFFSPWERIVEKKSKPGVHGEEIAEVVTINIIMRGVGMMIRTIMIILGTLTTLMVFWLGLLFFILWTILPIAAVVSLVYGISLLV